LKRSASAGGDEREIDFDSIAALSGVERAGAKGAVRGEIELVTDRPGESTLVVPIQGYLP
jgi:hypothetical protein